MIRQQLRKLKNLLLPRDKSFRRLWFGIGAGLYFPLSFSDGTMFYLGMYEMELNRYFRELVPPGTKCFDVGGSIGYTACVLAKLSDGAPVTTFEPNNIQIKDMYGVFAYNQLNITAVQKCVSHVSNSTNITLDDACEQYFVPEFVKIDVDGAEVDVLLGAEALLGKYKPNIILETHGIELEEACIKILKEHGYSVQIVNQRKWFKENRPIDHNRWIIGRAKTF